MDFTQAVPGEKSIRYSLRLWLILTMVLLTVIFFYLSGVTWRSHKINSWAILSQVSSVNEYLNTVLYWRFCSVKQAAAFLLSSIQLDANSDIRGRQAVSLIEGFITLMLIHLLGSLAGSWALSPIPTKLFTLFTAPDSQSTFPKCIKPNGQTILRLWNCEMFSQVALGRSGSPSASLIIFSTKLGSELTQPKINKKWVWGSWLEWSIFFWDGVCQLLDIAPRAKELPFVFSISSTELNINCHPGIFGPHPYSDHEQKRGNVTKAAL